jgi:2-polyprenyl-6-methoxyphenol hydroxylase-like FAD-dependent oxidoreductase
MTLISGETDVLVVGAGPVGLALACGLARAGTCVRIVEQRAGKAETARATTIAPRTLEVLDDLGVVGAALDGVWTDLPVRQYKDGALMFDASVVAAAMPRSPEVPYPVAARPLPTWRVEQVLTDRLAELGVKVEADCALVALEQGGEQVTAQLRSLDGAACSVVAQYVVGCDGGHSTVRDLAGISFENVRDHEFSVYIGELTIDGIEPTYARMWLSGDGFVFASPIPLTRNWQLQAQIPAADMADPPPFTVDVAQRLVTTRSGQPGITCRDLTWSSTYTIRERRAAS